MQNSRGTTPHPHKRSAPAQSATDGTRSAGGSARQESASVQGEHHDLVDGAFAAARSMAKARGGRLPSLRYQGTPAKTITGFGHTYQQEPRRLAAADPQQERIASILAAMTEPAGDAASGKDSEESSSGGNPVTATVSAADDRITAVDEPANGDDAATAKDTPPLDEITVAQYVLHNMGEIPPSLLESISRIQLHATDASGRRRKRHQELEKLGDVLQREIADRGWRQGISSGVIMGNWRSIVGDTIADHTKVEMIKETTLFLSTDSTAWATNLRLMQPMLLQRIAEKIGDGYITTLHIFPPRTSGGSRRGRWQSSNTRRR
ncbi:DciA family protein [Corynebacterium choanae]|uniref:DUF721 domain-containing protein n=1 Tax=Corynebacterium choanae TaxID=1862358 RepID=A0A3G6J3D6_9CORY|nr:DciA family protein [Corynebacterium choanae]AZA12439.1 hypothetical protein CCHOA_00020 [Corynebacterium choanae]